MLIGRWDSMTAPCVVSWDGCISVWPTSRKAVVRHQLSAGDPSPLILAPASAGIGKLLDSCGPDSVLVVEDIGHNPDVWRAVCSSQRVTVAFDLYYCGIAFFDPQRSRQQYIVNF